MSRVTAMLSLAAAISVAACSEQPTAPAVEPAVVYAKGDNDVGGGVARPHFINGGTSCALDTSTGVVTCDYKVAGLGKSGSALLTLAGMLDVDYQCVDDDGVVQSERETVRFIVDVDAFANESGNAVGTLSGTPSPLNPRTCRPYRVFNLTYSLNPAAVEEFRLPFPFFYLPGEWSFGVVVKTAMGDLQWFPYAGSLVTP